MIESPRPNPIDIIDISQEFSSYPGNAEPEAKAPSLKEVLEAKKAVSPVATFGSLYIIADGVDRGNVLEIAFGVSILVSTLPDTVKILKQLINHSEPPAEL